MIPQIVDKYLTFFPEDCSKLELLLSQIKDGQKLDGRTNFIGHITAGAIIFSPDKKSIAVIYHPNFSMWQFPGGHWDEGEAGPWIAARREAQEETGLEIKLQVLLDNDKTLPVEINSHHVPANPSKNEPEHFHHDFRYVFVAAKEDFVLNDKVITQAKWANPQDLKSKYINIGAQRAVHLLNS